MSDPDPKDNYEERARDVAKALRELANDIEHGDGQERVGGVFCVWITPTGATVVGATHPELPTDALLRIVQASNMGLSRLIAAHLGEHEELDQFHGLVGEMLTTMKGGDA